MASWILILMSTSGILRNVELNMKPKPKGYESTLEKTRPNHLNYSAVTSTKLPICNVILKGWRRKKKEKWVVVF